MNEDSRNIEKSTASLNIEAPESAGEAAELFRRFSDLKKNGEDVRVLIQDSPFCPMAKSDHLGLSSRNMTGISEVSRKDLLAVCGGGVTLARLRKAVEAEGLYFAYDPEFSSTDLTLGALVMDGAISRYEKRYGRLRESILSIEIVTAAGEIIHTGSRSVKDVAGYELAGLLTGGGGQYGLISSVTLRLHPAPAATTMVAVIGERDLLAGIVPGGGHSPLMDANIAAAEIFDGRMPGLMLGDAAEKMGLSQDKGPALQLIEIHEPLKGQGSYGASALNRFTPSGCSHHQDDGSLESLRQGLVMRLAGLDKGEKVSGPGMLQYISFDLRGPVSLPGQVPFGWASLMPHRNIIIWPESSSADPGKTCCDEEEIFRYVKENFAPGARLRAGYIRSRGDGVAVQRVRPCGGAGGLAGLSAWLEESHALSKISDRIRRLFDPEGIIDDGLTDD